MLRGRLRQQNQDNTVSRTNVTLGYPRARWSMLAFGTLCVGGRYGASLRWSPKWLVHGTKAINGDLTPWNLLVAPAWRPDQLPCPVTRTTLHHWLGRCLALSIHRGLNPGCVITEKSAPGLGR